MASLAHQVGRRVSVAGLICASRQTHTAQGKPMQFLSLVDESGMADLTLMPGGADPVIHPHLGPWLASGEVEQRYDVITLAVSAIEPLRRQGQELPAWMLRPGA
jgi:DNA polymerase III alpha subunit